MTATGPAEPAGTFSREDELPRLPVPDLPATGDRFLEWVRPILTEQQFADTEQSLRAFVAADGLGPQLHERLLQHDRTPGRATWADDFFHQRYVSRRAPVVINANYFFLFHPLPQVGQIERAARLIRAAVDFKQRIDDETLPPVTRRGAPVSMQQYKYLFSATRIPGDPMDSSRVPYTADWPGPAHERQVVVLRRGHIVAVDAMDDSGEPYDVDELVPALADAVRHCDDLAEGDAVGALTTQERARWAHNRDALLQAGNAGALDTVERALFCVCLDDQAPAMPTDACAQLLAGPAEGRWFDKGLSFIVAADGTAGFNGEHCRLDGTTVISFLDAVLEAAPIVGTGRQRTPRVAPVTFHLTPQLRDEIGTARAEFADRVADTVGQELEIDFSADRAKQHRISPDAFAQLSFQLAYARAVGATVSTYESVAMTGFRHGRTEAMRVVTPESAAFTSVMDDDAVDAATKRAALRAAAEAHTRRAAQCRDGAAPEQHLWELLMIHQRAGGAEAIPFFESPGWQISQAERISTSAVPSPNVRYWGFGPTGPECLGIAYAPLPHRFHTYLCVRRSNEAQLRAFQRELPRATADLDRLLTE